MARVLIPTNPRRYNPNPRGSATTTVTMRSDNPFERGVRASNARMLPGMGALEIPSSLTQSLPASTVEAAKSTTGINWGGITENLLNTAVKVGGDIATTKLGTPKAQPMQTPTIQYLQAVNPSAYAAEIMPGQSTASKMPMILIAIGVVGLGAVFLLRKKR